MRKHHTASTDHVRHEAHPVPESLERNTDHHAVTAFQREGPLEAPSESCGAVVRIHTTLSPAPFLKHPQLTPAQKRYLDSVAGSQSAERVYSLVNQHYLNVLRRRIRPGPQEEYSMVPVAAEVEIAQEPEEPQSKAVRRAKHKQPIRTAAAAAKHSGKMSLTKVPAKKTRPPANVKSPNANKNKMETANGSWSELLGEDDLEASLRESLSSLSMEDDQDSVYGDSPR